MDARVDGETRKKKLTREKRAYTSSKTSVFVDTTAATLLEREKKTFLVGKCFFRVCVNPPESLYTAIAVHTNATGTWLSNRGR